MTTSNCLMYQGLFKGHIYPVFNVKNEPIYFTILNNNEHGLFYNK